LEGKLTDAAGALALRAIIPRREDCTKKAVKTAMDFLTDEWLVDVATDYTGKCTIIAAALTLIERTLLPDRPAFFVTAGRRGGGKTTTLTMLIMAITGLWPAAAAWSTNEEERRKALISYFLYGVPYIAWDNIARGMQISCPHIEKSCTAAYYSDRKLGVSEMVCTAASTIQFFTRNNIGPRGDLASRSLRIRLDVDRADPENRKFRHPDPVGWAENNRAEILAALFTILLGNPSSRSRATPRQRPGSRCGGGLLVRRSKMPPNSSGTSSILRICSSSRKKTTRRARRSLTCSTSWRRIGRRCSRQSTWRRLSTTKTCLVKMSIWCANTCFQVHCHTKCSQQKPPHGC
jgi:hypothetical protein